MSFLSQSVRVAVLTSLLLSPLPATSQSQQVAKRRVDSQRLSRIGTRMKSLVDTGDIVGAVTLVARHGEVLSLQAVGFQDLESRKPMRTDTIFDIRSVTKTVTAISVMIVVGEGKLSLNDPVEKYLPEFKTVGPKAHGPITIHHLLTHTSGLPFSRPAEIEDITIKRDRSLADVVTLLAKQQPEFAPGTQLRYNSGGFAILGRIIEVVSGKPYEQFIQERVFDPLGMADSFFFIPPAKRDRVAAVYRRQDRKLARWHEIEDYARSTKYPDQSLGCIRQPEISRRCAR